MHRCDFSSLVYKQTLDYKIPIISAETNIVELKLFI